jgi:hypothetical protein
LKKDYILPSLAALCIIALLVYGPIPQDQDYHNFADQREFLSIPNFLNVITNLPFAILALFGLRQIRNLKEKKLKHIGLALFVSFILVTLGSGYYHLWPKNETLVYDRIPITVILMSFFTFLIYDLIDRQKGYNAFIILNLLGITSVLYWYLGERQGSGDLRWYAMVQFFPVIAIPVILILYKSSFNHYKEVVPVFLFFGLAKLAESFDEEIYHLLNNIISGHSLKHLFMAAVEYKLVRLMARRVKSADSLPGNMSETVGP